MHLMAALPSNTGNQCLSLSLDFFAEHLNSSVNWLACSSVGVSCNSLLPGAGILASGC